MSVCVLLSTYNGCRFIGEQIDSLLDQNIENTILIRDDGSKDSTLEILKTYKNNNPSINYYGGYNLGFSLSFFDLVKNSPKSDYFAFCDQDDVWDKDKLRVAVEYLMKEDNSLPLLYCSGTRLVDEQLNFIDNDVYTSSDLMFFSLLLGNISPGCTFVFNSKAKEMFLQYDTINYKIYFHDYLMIMICKAFGKVIYDKIPHISYRQHSGNTIGSSNGFFGKTKTWCKQFFTSNKKRIRRWDILKGFYTIYFEKLDNFQRDSIILLKDYRNSCKKKRKLMWNKNLSNKNFLSKLVFRISVFFNKI